MIWRLRGRRRGSVTLAKSNAKALLTACGHQKVLFALSEGDAERSVMPRSVGRCPGNCGCLPSRAAL